MALRRERRATAPLGSAGDTHHEGANPLLVEFRALTVGGREPMEAEIERLTARYAFAIPTDAALAAIRRHSPGGVVELGAGTGYWASLLDAAGVATVAYDIAPPMSPDNKWFHSSTAWFDVQQGDDSAIAVHGDHTLLLVWPTRDQTWPADALDRFHTAGGRTVITVGEAAGNRTGDARFHALLGAYEHCLACTYGVHDLACVCGTRPLWRLVDTVSLPHWPGHHDDLHVYVRRDPPGDPLGRRSR